MGTAESFMHTATIEKKTERRAWHFPSGVFIKKYRLRKIQIATIKSGLAEDAVNLICVHASMPLKKRNRYQRFCLFVNHFEKFEMR